MTNETLKLVWDGKIATIQLNDLPTRNAITIDMVTAFDCALDAVEANAKALIVTGAGTAFCSGANLMGGLGAEGDPATFDAGLVLDTHIRDGLVCLHRDRQRISGSSAGCFLELPIWAFMEGGRSPTGMKAHIGGQFHAATFTGRLSKYA